MVRTSLARLVQQAAQVAAQEATPRTSSGPRARKAVIELTDAAAARIRELLSERHKVRA